MNKSIFQDQYFLDFHTHSRSHTDSENVMEIVSIHLGQEKEKKFFTVGLHPWWTKELITVDQTKILVSQLTDIYCLAMGEIGIDRLKGSSLGLQMNILRSQLKIAQELSIPVIIHCVRAFDQLIQIKKEFSGIKKWCIHGFGRHSILARQLIDHGFYLSLMPSSPAKYSNWFESLPMDRLFLETDSKPGVNIEEIYTLVSNLIGMEMSELCLQMNNNARDFFKR